MSQKISYEGLEVVFMVQGLEVVLMVHVSPVTSHRGQ